MRKFEGLLLSFGSVAVLLQRCAVAAASPHSVYTDIRYNKEVGLVLLARMDILASTYTRRSSFPLIKLTIAQRKYRLEEGERYVDTSTAG